MPISLTTLLDGTGREPRAGQLEILGWLEANWDKAEVLAIQAPTGEGKSFIARTIQRATAGRIIVPSNMLMSQYSETYPLVNAFRGKAHYQCQEDAELTCAERKELEMPPCKNCVYRGCRQIARAGQPSLFNPMSLYYLQDDPLYKPARVVIVDEAHELLDMLMLVAGKKYLVTKWGQPESMDQLGVATWLLGHRDRLKGLTRSPDMTTMIRALRDLEGVELLLHGLETNPQNYVFYLSDEPYRGRTERYVTVKPVQVPPGLLKRVLDADKVILLSATLLPMDRDALANGRPMLFLDAPSPIPVEDRLIRYLPLPERMNYKTAPETVVKALLALCARHQGENTLVHATYDQARRWGPLMRSLPLVTHTADDKEEKLAHFKTTGGVFLASGCAEGVDLPGDQCRVNIVPSLQRLNPEDQAVKRRLAMEGGRQWYELEALKTVIQQAGRSTRGLGDHSRIYILDPQFPEYFARNREHLPKAFTEAVRWTA